MKLRKWHKWFIASVLCLFMACILGDFTNLKSFNMGFVVMFAVCVIITIIQALETDD